MPPLRRPTRRTVLTASLLLLMAGAAVNVAVAWALMAGCEREGMTVSVEPVPAFHVPPQESGSAYWGGGSRRFRWRCLPPLPGGVWVVEEVHHYEDALFSQATVASGWPMLTCRVAYHELTKAPAPGRLGGSPAPEWLTSRGWFSASAGRIPNDLLPAGFAINTLFYAVVVGALLALPLSAFPIRRHLRARRGRCPKCGYDLAGLRGGAQKAGKAAAPCPECGATR